MTPEQIIDNVCSWQLTKLGKRGQQALSSPCMRLVYTPDGGLDVVGIDPSLVGRQE